MKKMLTVFVSVFIFTACTKEAKRCWKCTVKTTISNYSYGSWTASPPSERIVDACDKSQAEIMDYQASGTHVRTSSNQTVSEVMTCKEQ